MPEPAKHTPGPWEVERVNSDYPHDICLGYDIPGEGCPILIATVFSDEDDAPISVTEANANARLIAAAPDLLEACRRALDAVDRDTVEWDILSTAITKATLPETTR